MGNALSQQDSFLTAARQGRLADVEESLKEERVDVNAVDENGCSALFYASDNGHVDVVRLLLDRNANIEAAAKDQWTALYIASRNGHVNVIRLLLDRKANMNVATNHGCTAFSSAAQFGHIDVVRLLLARNASVNSIDANGDTPLIYAAIKGHASIVKMLLKHGAIVNVQNRQGKNALDYAFEQNRMDIAQLIQTALATKIQLKKAQVDLIATPVLIELNRMDIVQLIQTASATKTQSKMAQEDLSPSTQTSAIATPVPISLDQLKYLCGNMHEAQAMCTHIYSRLVLLGQLLSTTDVTRKEVFQNEYDAMLRRFHAFLVQFGDERVISRIVGSRAVTSVCQELHEKLNALIKNYKVDIRSDDLDWEARFQLDSAIQRGLLTSMLQQNHWKKELVDTDAQAEALTIMMYELNNRAGEYDPKELKLIRQIFSKVSRYSKTGIPAVPSWFLPPHDVEFGDEIDRGSYGSVHRGSWMGTSIAVKSVIFEENLNVENREIFLKEADIWFSLQHPHIVKLYGACHVGNPLFVCELASNGNLPDYVYGNPEKTWKCLHEAALGLWYLHTKRKIVHRDIKGNNILVCQDGVAKLTDFGLSCLEADLPPSGNSDEVGAIRWKAPEIISGECSGSFASDVYSFGMTILEIATQIIPWDMMPDVAVKHKVVNLRELPRQPAEISDSQWDVIKRMCSSDPGGRIGMATVVKELKEFAAQELDDYLQKQWECDELKNESIPDCW